MKTKILIFISAYTSKQQIETVIKKLPKEIYTKHHVEILIIDDSLNKSTFNKAHSFKLSDFECKMTILFNPNPLGYGGNAKLGLWYMLKNNFDIIVFLSANEVLISEKINEFIDPIINKSIDAVIGTRFIKYRQTKIPRFRFIANKFLTKIQNFFLKTDFSELHSIYRAYSKEIIKKIPFQNNTNEVHFDSQMIIQLILAKANIIELPIPYEYNDKENRIKGRKFFFKVIADLFKLKLHSISILYQRNFDINLTDFYYSAKLGYASSHSYAIVRVNSNSSVIDIGCNNGLIARELKNKNCIVDGIDYLDAGNVGNFDNFTKLDLNEAEKMPKLNKYDFILLLDIIEHLNNPEEFMDILREKSGRKYPTVILTTPNIAFFIIRLNLLLSNFNYGKQGILDLTHKRLFTFTTIQDLCKQSGYKIVKVRGIPAPFPKAFGKNIFSKMLLKLNIFLIHLSKSIFSYQIYLEVVPTPVVDELLSYSIEESNKF